MGLLDAKVVIVTGAGRGIGRSIALAAATDGARVVVNDFGVTLQGRDPTSDVADAVVAEIVDAGGAAVANADSVSSVAGAQRIVQTAVDEWGRVDGVVTCAGIVWRQPFLETSEDDWDAVVDIHLKGTFAMFRVAAEAMALQGDGGSLVGISSGVLYGDADHASYRAAKAGIVALMMSVALAGEPHSIRANAIAPLADTRMTQNVGMEAPSPDDVAPLAVYLLSDLSQAVTGRVISIAGGRLATWKLPTEDAVHMRDGRWTPGAIHEAISPS